MNKTYDMLIIIRFTFKDKVNLIIGKINPFLSLVEKAMDLFM
jgi:hypothetical protein